MSKTVRYKVNLANLPPLTEAQRTELEVLATRPDREIDYGDIAPLAETLWRNAVRNPFYKPTKQATTVRLDTDVLAWLKAPGKGYNRALLSQSTPEQNGGGK
ncbi:BrnA antitoxin family protein [Brenneria tiliae]|uniref:BrnA antitoxin family protein n=1 Tax=Brenneria tiliae TaxID=2914984 RepID=UPI002014D74E|nr:BrnA antitoxin family protein [Brenneria tiliae]MCL2898758.1 BrnA antitoxin family protein [Brenneria tiliae]MCL2903305.1 BrnA antitoxin family protein [Brenneria tiliae]